jgi:D-sedoheptulose 7-phosphate isomerase
MKKERPLDLLCERFPVLNIIREPVTQAAEIIITAYSHGGKVLICGNGGSSADADHVAGEFMKSFELCRPLEKSFMARLCQVSATRGKYLSERLEHSLPAISLSAHTSAITAISNDIGPSMIFAQQIIGYGNERDVLIGISTSGNSSNIIDACITAKALNLNIIGITGNTGGKMKQYCDVLVNVPGAGTAMIQELHLPVLHTICRIVENHFYKNK